ncbi:hypothetical protein B0H11DRAFT_2297912 [Mycena galericulata]|nr:hypothetical protein B0H11DRAFT_2297912 [Mycena galericulata]
MAPRVQVDLSEDVPFNPNLFTGRGKTFPPGGADDIGSTEVLAVPSDIHHIPDAELPVTAFAALDLPEQFPAFILTNPRIWYRTDLPATDILHLMSRPIPSAEFLSQLKKEVGQAPFNAYAPLEAPLTRAPVPVALTPAPVPVPLAPVAVANAEAELGVAAMAKSELVAKTGDVDEGEGVHMRRTWTMANLPSGRVPQLHPVRWTTWRTLCLGM